MAGKAYIGTSGWNYKHWRERFYPPGLGPSKWLAHHAAHFNTVEVNNSFYRIPAPETVAAWSATVPAGFLFALKLWRAATHYRRLRDTTPHLERFFLSAERLAVNRRGPLLVQLPPQLGKDVARLESFLADLKSVATRRWKVAVEFRDDSWLCREVYAALNRHKTAVCLHDMPGKGAASEPNEVEFVYVRRHGTTGRYDGAYSPEQVEADARAVRGWLSRGRSVFVYYNNDIGGHAVTNARQLVEAVERG